MKSGRLCLLVLSLSLFAIGTFARDIPQDNDDDDVDDSNGELSIDEMIFNSTDNGKADDLAYDPNPLDTSESLIRTELDIIMSVGELKALRASKRGKRGAPIKAGKNGSKRWPNHRIPYMFEEGVFTEKQQAGIRSGMSSWARYTCLTFPYATTGKRIVFKNGKGCASRLGRTGGKAQKIGLGPNCRYKKIVLHEVGHAIGLFHEQTRPDRDNYVKVLNDHINPKKLPNFKKHTEGQMADIDVPYDYLSIMHYSGGAFGQNRTKAIQTLDKNYQSIIGRTKELSFRDIKTVNLMYNCREALKCKLNHSDCPGEGFVGKDCTCWCPGNPYVPCNPPKEPINVPNQPQAICKDNHKSCKTLAKNNECETHPTYMMELCRKSCNFCGNKTPRKDAVHPSTTPSSSST